MMDNNKLAVIDLGTNTFHLLIVEQGQKSFQKLFSDKMFLKIGQDGISNGIIHENAIKKIQVTFAYFKDKLEEYQVSPSHIKAFATSAFRNAKNGMAVAEMIFQQTGIQIEIIDGNREAELIYHGVRNALEIGHHKSLIIDIGGGSVEFIICTGTEILWKASFEIGGQRLLDQFMKHDPISEEEKNALNTYLSSELIPLDKAIQEFNPEILIGSSGSFDTLVEIRAIHEGIDFSWNTGLTEYALNKNEFEKIYQDLIHKNKEQRMETPGLISMRVDMIVVAISLIRYLVIKYDFETIRTSTYALKEGVLFELLGR